MAGMVLIGGRSFVSRRRSRGVSAALRGAVVLIIAYYAFDCRDIDDAPHAWRSSVEARAW